MSRVRILVVDDEPGMLRAIGRVLGAAHHVTVSGSSREALARAAAAPPDLAILDIRMPELDGFELMARLKALHPDIDVILMTGSIDDQDEKLVRAIRGARLLLHPEAVRSRGAADTGGPLRGAAAAA